MKKLKLLALGVALTLMCGRLATAVTLSYTCSTFNSDVLTMKCHFGYSSNTDYLHYSHFMVRCVEDAKNTADTTAWTGWLGVTQAPYQSYFTILEFCTEGLTGTWQWHTETKWQGTGYPWDDKDDNSSVASWSQTPQHQCSGN